MVMSLKNNPYRTHMCGSLTSKHIGADVRVAGWVNGVRKMGKLIFLTLRDQTGIVQIFIENENLIKGVTKESAITVSGLVRSRGEKNINEKMQTGEIEVVAKTLEVLGKCAPLPFEISKAREQDENTRIKYRYLDLRNEKNFKNIYVRAEMLKFVRQQMDDMGFLEIQTPILTSSSPEGARDYLVPSRLNPGNFYALPQSPQQFKQLLMVSGFTKYYQIAPCFRDEDARADRSPTEFYQIDFEQSFATQEDILGVLEKLMYNVFTHFSSFKMDKPPFKRIKFNDAMEMYGSDKPDLRNPLVLINLTKELKKSSFSVFKGSYIFGIKAVSNDKPRKFFDTLTSLVKQRGAKALIYLKYSNKDLVGSASKYLTDKDKKAVILKAKMKEGDTLFIVSDKNRMNALTYAGFLRIKLGEKLDLIEKNTFRPCFIVDFPFYERGENGQVEFSHNPFSMPQGGLEALATKDPFKIYAYQYDFVLNGVEVASGAVRNHSREIMVKAFKLAGYSKEVVESKFPALFNAFKYGAPPHAGAAAGFDRMVMFITNEDSIKEVFAFPMNKSAQDPLMGAPNSVTDAQLKEVHIKLDIKKK